MSCTSKGRRPRIRFEASLTTANASCRHVVQNMGQLDFVVSELCPNVFERGSEHRESHAEYCCI